MIQRQVKYFIKKIMTKKRKLIQFLWINIQQEVMKSLAKLTMRSITMTPKYCFQFPSTHSDTHSKPGLTAKRIISCVSDRLNKYDPERWNGVPISFNTNFRDEGGYIDVETAIQVHEALQREFGIEIKDRNILITDIETAFYVVNQHHDAV